MKPSFLHDMANSVNLLNKIFCSKSHNNVPQEAQQNPFIVAHTQHRIFPFHLLSLNVIYSNTDGLFTMAVSNSFLSPLEKIPRLQIWDNFV